MDTIRLQVVVMCKTHTIKPDDHDTKPTDSADTFSVGWTFFFLNLNFKFTGNVLHYKYAEYRKDQGL